MGGNRRARGKGLATGLEAIALMRLIIVKGERLDRERVATVERGRGGAVVERRGRMPRQRETGTRLRQGCHLLLAALLCLWDPRGSCSMPLNGEMRVVTVGAGTATNNRTRTLVDVESMLGDAALLAGRFDLVVLPELFSFLHDREHGSGEELGPPQSGAELAEGGETTEACRRWARTWECYVVCSFAELGDSSTAGPQQQGRPVYNVAMLIDRKGIEVGRYRKTFPAYGTEFEEGFTPSPPVFSLPVWETDFGRVSLLICFDLHFAELWQEVELSGADLVVWPSATGGTAMAQAYALIHQYAVVQQPDGVLVNPFGDLVPALYTSSDKRVKIFPFEAGPCQRAAGTPTHTGEPSCSQEGAEDICRGPMCTHCTERGRDMRREARHMLGKLRRCLQPHQNLRDSTTQHSDRHNGGRVLWEGLWQHLDAPQGQASGICTWNEDMPGIGLQPKK